MELEQKLERRERFAVEVTLIQGCFRRAWRKKRTKMCPQPTAAAFGVSRGAAVPHPGDTAAHQGDEHLILILLLTPIHVLRQLKKMRLFSPARAASGNGLPWGYKGERRATNSGFFNANAASFFSFIYSYLTPLSISDKHTSGRGNPRAATRQIRAI